MRVFLILLTLVSAGVHARPETWSAVQSFGGAVLEAPQKWAKGWVLPLRVNVSGTEAASVTPTVANPAKFCHSVQAIVSGHNIYLTVISATYRVDLSAHCPPATLGHPAAGKYRVYYRSPGDEPVTLGAVTVGP